MKHDLAYYSEDSESLRPRDPTIQSNDARERWEGTDNGGLACPVLDVRAPDDGYIDVEALVGGATSVDDSADEPAPPASADIRSEGLKGACGRTANFANKVKGRSTWGPEAS